MRPRTHHSSFAMALLAIVAAATSCDDQPSVAQKSAALEINIQVAGATNLQPMMEELNRRGMKATVWLSAQEMNDSCTYVGTLASQGHEIAGKYPGQIEDSTSYEEQKTEIDGMLAASTQCAGKAMTGFRATRFTANDDTFRLLDDLDVPYLVRSNRQVLLSIYTFLPYRLEGHEFSVLPMPLAVFYGETASLCDTATAGKLTSAELLGYEKASIDSHIKLGEPLVLEWHPEVTHPGSEACWSTFVGTLDYIESKGASVKVVTAESIVQRHPATQSLSAGSEE